MTFRVTFAQPVTYQPGHPIAARKITEMIVCSDTATNAQLHAVRVTVGDPGTITVEEAG